MGFTSQLSNNWYYNSLSNSVIGSTTYTTNCNREVERQGKRLRTSLPQNIVIWAATNFLIRCQIDLGSYFKILVCGRAKIWTRELARSKQAPNRFSKLTRVMIFLILLSLQPCLKFGQKRGQNGLRCGLDIWLKNWPKVSILLEVLSPTCGHFIGFCPWRTWNQGGNSSVFTVPKLERA